jgi:hypothetical protein
VKHPWTNGPDRGNEPDNQGGDGQALPF